MRQYTKHFSRPALLAAAVCVALALAWWAVGERPPAPWTPQEVEVLGSLRLASLPPPPPDPSNAVANDPRAAALGHRLFFDTRLSANGQVSCASCHQPGRRFTDGLSTARAIGRSKRNTASLIGAAYSPWLYWDGRRDSQWAQALSPLEDSAEHGGNRLALVRLLAGDPHYRAAYRDLFGPLPDLSDTARFPTAASPLGARADWHKAWHHMREADRIAVNRAFANMGKAIAAYERKLQPGPSRFDRYVDAVLAREPERQEALFSPEEERGLRLFMTDARCLECHNGPLLTNNEFHNTGLLPAPGSVPDTGRSAGARLVTDDPFNCLGRYSDAGAGECAELTYMRTGPELIGAMRTPSLRNLAGSEPYMHKGQLHTLADVLEHYNEALPATIGHNEAEPLGLSGRQLRQLEAFLNTLDAPPAAARHWLRPPD